MKALERLAGSKPLEIVLTALVYCVYTATIAVSLTPSVWLMLKVLPPLIGPIMARAGAGALPSAVEPGATVLWIAARVAGVLGCALYLYVFVGAAVQSAVVRLLSLGIKPGRYRAISLTTVRWLIYSGVYTISIRTVLPLVPVTFVSNMYFRIAGCRMGRNVRLNTFMLVDPQMLTLEDDVVVGGGTEISCHLFEKNHLILKPIHIGKGTLVGAHSYISPGVRIGSNCLIGLSCYIRKDRVIPDGSVFTSLGSTDLRTAREVERGLVRRANP